MLRLKLIAQIDPTVTINSEDVLTTFKFDKPVTFKGGHRYVFVYDILEKQFIVENYYWFIFKNWFKRIRIGE